MTESTGDEAVVLREELARLVGEMTVIELKALLLALTEMSRERARDRRKTSTRQPGVNAGRGKRRRER